MMDNKLLVATYLTKQEKDWLKHRAAKNMRSLAAELRLLVIAKMQKENQ